MGVANTDSKERLKTLRKYQILDSGEDTNYNEIAELASLICNTPVALITFIDETRQWFKAHKGWDTQSTDVKFSFCAHTIRQDEIMIVEDAEKDTRFRTNPFVKGDPRIRFYAGVQLRAGDGYAIGTLAVLDVVPRKIDQNQILGLKILGRQLEVLLEMRLKTTILTRTVDKKEVEFSEILNRINDAFVAVDLDWMITFFNEHAAKITRKRPEEVIGKNLWEQFAGSITSSFIEAAQKAINTQQAQYTEDYLSEHDVWVERYLYPSPTGMSIFFRDTTERKRIEAALTESESNYRKLIEGNPQPMWIYKSDDLKIVEVNEAAIGKYGYPRDEFLNLTILDLRPAEEAVNLMKFLKGGEIADKGFTQSGPWKHKLRNGQLIDVEISSHTISWQGMKARFTTVWDVTQRLQMERSLRLAEEQYRSIFQNATEGIFQSTPEGKFITVNPAMAKMFGYSSPDDLMGPVKNTAVDLYNHPDIRAQLTKALEEHGSLEGIEIRMVKRDKGEIWVRANLRAVKDEDGALKYFEGALEDITQRKERAEERMRIQFNELQKTNEELDRFVYSISHDLRAPLATILGLVHVAQLESPSPKFAEYFTMIQASIKRLDGFINDILDYSLNSRKDVQAEHVNFHELVADLLKNFNYLPESDRLKVNLQINNTHPFHSDGHRISIILNNLFSNSIKYQDFRKEESFVSLQITTLPGKAILRFTDNGVGIQREHLNKIFNMFYRASADARGSGLGLYIARETISKLGGSITVESTYGESTTFYLELPDLQRQI